MVTCSSITERGPSATDESISTPLFIGPGYATAAHVEDEPWKETNEPVKYIPLQAKQGDLAIYLKNEAFEIEFEREKYLIVPQSAILLLIRNEDFSV